jgi:hypothetical protein
MITMYDSTSIDQIPGDASVVAGYVNGHPATYSSLCEKFPHARHVSIAVTAEADADFLDVEKKNARPDQIPEWYHRQKARGVARPGIYASVDPIRDTILPILSRAGIARASVCLWAAHYTHHPHICGPDSCREILTTRVDGTQWTDKALGGRTLDQSSLSDDFFGEPKPPTMYPCEGHKSLEGLSQQLNNAPSTMLRLTAEHSPGGKFYSGIAGYLNGVFAADRVNVPQYVDVYYPTSPSDPTPERFHSHGDQTLQGLANSFGCKPAEIVQYTAENSPDKVFSKGMADYLNAVFARSTTHVPSGTHLFYQK